MAHPRLPVAASDQRAESSTAVVDSTHIRVQLKERPKSQGPLDAWATREPVGTKPDTGPAPGLRE